MKIVFSRKGWDSAAGGRPSPILDGCPISLPIPGGPGEPRRFGDLKACTPRRSYPMGDILRDIGSNVRETHPVHDDPKFFENPLDPFALCQVAFGQASAAQAHLENRQVGPGDIFLFFGLFRDYGQGRTPDHRPHHRIFAMMRVEKMIRLGENPDPDYWKSLRLPATHSHIHRRRQKSNNSLWLGPGRRARWARDELRLTAPHAPPSCWRAPDWLARSGLSYHANSARWHDGHLDLVSRGQEFVTDVDPASNPEAMSWLAGVESAIAA